MELGQQGLDGVEVGGWLIVDRRLAERDVERSFRHRVGRRRSRHPEQRAERVPAVSLRVRHGEGR